MGKAVMSGDELREALTEARTKQEELDAAIQNMGEDTDATVLADLESQFEAEERTVDRLSKAIERRERMDKAVAVARPDKDPATDDPEVRIRVSVAEERTYREGGPHSFFHDLLAVTHGDVRAQARLARHERETEIEERALTTGAGSGVGFVAPQYLQARWAQIARAARPLADYMGSLPLPPAGTSFNVPRVTTGATTAVQASEAGAVNDNTPVTDDVTLTVSTIAGKVDMSRQAFDRSDPGLDVVLGQDLINSYNQQVDSEIINGPGSGGRVKGLLSAIPAGNQVTLSTAGYAALYPKMADAVQRIDTSRFLPADAAVMHPRRWASLLGSLDGTNNRPLIVPATVAANPMAEQTNMVSQGIRGFLSIGLPVITDPNIPTNLGAGTNEDRVLFIRRDDNLLFESGTPTVRVYEEVLSGTLQVRIQAFGYIAFTAERYPLANAVIQGTGLVPPTF